MTWSYSGDPSTSELDKYRFLISDTNTNQPVLQDEEINYILDGTSDSDRRLFQLYERAANIFGRAVKRRLGPQSEDPTGRLKYFMDKADYYRRLCSSASGLSQPVSTCTIFTKGMNDNVR